MLMSNIGLKRQRRLMPEIRRLFFTILNAAVTSPPEFLTVYVIL